MNPFLRNSQIQHPLIHQNMSMQQLKALNNLTLQFSGKAQLEKIDKIIAQEIDDQYTYLLFENKEDLDQAINELEQQNINSHKFGEKEQTSFTISVINLPQINEPQLTKEFKIFGNINFVRLIKDDDKELKGYGYITFSNESDFNKALNAKTFLIQEKVVHIFKRLPQDQLEQKQQFLEKLQLQREKKRHRHNKLDTNQSLFKIGKIEVNQNVQLKNEMKTAPRVLKKKIKKIQSQVGEDQFEVVKKFKQFKNGIQKKQDQFFQVPDQLKVRREARKKKMEQNRKKANKLHK